MTPMTVYATREGLPNQKTATNYIVEAHVPFVALPSNAALRLWVNVTNPANGKSIRALVLDLGPWNVADHEYVFGGARPQAESGHDMRGRETNRAGIDLGEAVWKALEMHDNGNVSWEFI
jgi:hypothetical protein